ncbi:hypothetical protein J6590_012480 [Homalodisca vitripennis]|nr:hypothetical protein J6590_012480 [Homalodisca vitripennis]
MGPVNNTTIPFYSTVIMSSDYNELWRRNHLAITGSQRNTSHPRSHMGRAGLAITRGLWDRTVIMSSDYNELWRRNHLAITGSQRNTSHPRSHMGRAGLAITRGLWDR